MENRQGYLFSPMRIRVSNGPSNVECWNVDADVVQEECACEGIRDATRVAVAANRCTAICAP